MRYLKTGVVYRVTFFVESLGEPVAPDASPVASVKKNGIAHSAGVSAAVYPGTATGEYYVRLEVTSDVVGGDVLEVYVTFAVGGVTIKQMVAEYYVVGDAAVYNFLAGIATVVPANAIQFKGSNDPRYLR